jgi:Flp pilus assembly protein CpaB
MMRFAGDEGKRVRLFRTTGDRPTMEAQLARERRRRQAVVIFGLILGVLAAVSTYYLSTRPDTTPQVTPQPQRTIVVAAVDIAARTQITEAMLRTASVPDIPAVFNADTDPTLAVGQVAVVNIFAGQPITPNLYSGANPAGVVILGPQETVGPDSPVWRAVSISVARERAAGGLVEAGDRVDVFVTLQIDVFDSEGNRVEAPTEEGAPYSGSATKLTFINVEVLFADAANAMYVLKVTQHQAEEIAFIQSGPNSFSLTLRPPADTREFSPELPDPSPLVRDSYGATIDMLIDKYGFPVPEGVIGILAPGPLPTPELSPEPEPEPSPEPSPSP